MKQQGWVWLGLKELINGLKLPKKIIEIPMDKTRLTKTYTSFAGSDVLYIINGVVEGEIDAITWEEDIVTKNVIGSIIITDFASNTDLKLKNNMPFDIVIVTANEYSPIYKKTIKNAIVVTARHAISVDDAVTEIVLDFTATEVTGYTKISNDELKDIKHGGKTE